MEQEYHTILVGIDGSKHAEEAFKKAIEIARRNHGKVIAVNVVDQPVASYMGYSSIGESELYQEEEISSVMINEVKEHAKHVDFHDLEAIIAYGSPKEELAKNLPNEYKIDLIMVGQSGKPATERFVMGSVASYVTRTAPCDVLVVSRDE